MNMHAEVGMKTLNRYAVVLMVGLGLGSEVLAAENRKAVPEMVTLPVATVKNLQDKAKDARIARLEAENLTREIEISKLRLEKLVEQANMRQEESDNAFITACEKAGIPASEVNNYEGRENEKGEFVLKRKTQK